jgi:uncharacterized protein (DUF2164 family)
MAGKRATISIDLIADASKAKAGLKQAEDAAGSLQNQFKNVAKTAGAAFATREIVNFGKTAVSAASDLAESMNAVQVTFGDTSDEILKMGENASKTVGMSARDFNAFAVQFAGFTKQVAGANGDVAAVTDELTVRIADFASVMNLDIPRAAQIFQSSLSGSSEPARAFGIDMSDAAVKAHALATGLVDSTAEMTEAEKVTARYSLLMEETSQMAGDFANTSDGLANSMRILEADLDNAKATIGEAMVPALEAVTTAVVPVLDAFTALPEGLQQTIVIGGGLIAATKSMSTTVQAFGVSANNANKFVGGLTAGVGLALIAFNQYQTAKSEIAAAANRVRDALDAETLAITENTEATIQQDFLTGELGKAMEMLGLDTELATAAVMGNTDAQQAFIEQMKQAREDSVGLGDGLRSIFDSSMLAIDAARIVEREYQGMTRGFQDAQAEAERLNTTNDESREQFERLIGPTEDYYQNINKSVEPTGDLSDAVDELWKSTDALYKGMFDLNPEFQKYLDTLDNEAAVRDLESAVADYDALLQDNTASEDELAEAKQRVAEQTRNVIEELGNVPAETQADLLIMVQDDQLEELIERTNRLKDALNAVSGDISTQMFNVEALRGTVEGLAGLGQRNIYAETMASKRPTRAMAAGGIVTGPTVARLGEHGPEAVIPLTGGNARGGLGATYNIVVNAGVGDPGSIGQKVVETIKAYERRNGNSWRQ